MLLVILLVSLFITRNIAKSGIAYASQGKVVATTQLCLYRYLIWPIFIFLFILFLFLINVKVTHAPSDLNPQHHSPPIIVGGESAI